MKYLTLIIGLIVVFGFYGFAQEEEEDFEKDVIIVKPYEPAISDAYKYSTQPKIEDTVRIPPSFDYTIESRKKEVDFDVEPIKAAKTVGEPLTKLYRGYIRLGYGNYFTPYAEIDYNALRSKNYLFGVTGKHISSGGKLKLVDDENVFSGYNDNKLGIYAKGFYNNSTVSGNLNYISSRVYYYGFDERYLNDIEPGRDREDIDNNTYNILDFNARYRSNYTDSLHFNYDINLDCYNIQHNDDNIFDANMLSVTGDINKFINYKKNILGSEFGISYYDQGRSFRFKTVYDTVKQYTVIKFDPYAGIIGDDWGIRVGLNTFVAYTDDNDPVFRFYPQASAQYNMVGNFLIPYFGITGDYMVNDFRSVLQENKFIEPRLAVYRSDYRIFSYGGIKGNFSPEMQYDVKVTYAKIDDMYFYVNNTENYGVLGAKDIYLMNNFVVVYDDIEYLDFFGELDFKYSKKLGFMLKADYSIYTMTNEFRPWHVPDYEVVFGAKYNLRNKILVNALIYHIGGQSVKSWNPGGIEDYIELDGTIDVSLGIEYRYSKILSAFIDLNNIASQNYYRWHNYPTQGFNFIAGITYSLLGEKSSVN